MCAFRAITAEEEAASALIFALRQRAYPDASKLNHRNHVHKVAITQFIKAASSLVAKAGFQTFTARIAPEADPPRLDVLLDLRQIGINASGPVPMRPDEPLNFVVRSDTPDGEFRVHDFQNQLADLAKGASVDSIMQHMKEEANLRNRLLYATDTGIPRVTLDPSFLAERQKWVMVLIGLTIVIQQTPAHQLFAVQAVKSLLRVIGKAESEVFEFDAATPQPEEGIMVHRADENATPVVRFVRRYAMQVEVAYRLLPVIHLDLNPAFRR